jgi:Uma2 family endonuclease
MRVLAERPVHWTEQEYLAFENSSPTKHEYFNGEVFAMAGARPGHNLVGGNCNAALHALVRARGCGTFTSDQRIYVASTGLYTYPGGGVVCVPLQVHTDGMCLLNPVLLFEVLSPATRDYDLGSKREHYRQIPSLRHLLLIDQPEQMIWHDHRTGGGRWQSRQIASGAIELPDLGGSIAFDEIYTPAGWDAAAQ